jgi:hypothetical protein
MNFNLREYSKQTSTRLIIGGLFLFFLVGGGLILWLYGPGGAAFGLLCISAGLFPVVIIMIVLWILDLIVKHGNREE